MHTSKNEPSSISFSQQINFLLRPVPWLLIGAMLVLFISCSSPVDEQVTAGRMTAVAADEMAAVTREAEDATSTAQAFENATSIAEAAATEAEATVSAHATADAESTANAEATSNANEQATADAEATTEAEATAEAEASDVAMAQATADFEATVAAIEEEKMVMIDEVRAETPLVSSQEGSLAHDEDDEPEVSPAGVNLRNFVAATHFSFNANETDLGTGDFALQFRSHDDASIYLYISQDGHWQVLSEEDGSQDSIQDGEVESLYEDDWNKLILFAEDEHGFFFLNDRYVDELNLDQTASTGEIAVATGLLPGAEVAGATTEFKDFIVWSMDPVPPTPTPVPQPTLPPQPTNPPQPTSPPEPPPPTSGNGRIVVVNQTKDLNLEVYLRNCCDNWTFPAPADQVTVQEYPIDEYAWGVQGHGCLRDLPQLFLKDYDDTVLLVLPTEEGCPWALQLYMPE